MVGIKESLSAAEEQRCTAISSVEELSVYDKADSRLGTLWSCIRYVLSRLIEER